MTGNRHIALRLLTVLVCVFSPAPALSAAVQPELAVRVVRTAVIVSEPRGDADVVGTVTPGEVLDLLDERGSWYLVRPPNDGTPRDWRTGWISQEMVELLGTPTTARPPAVAPQQPAVAPAASRGVQHSVSVNIGYFMLQDEIVSDLIFSKPPSTSSPPHLLDTFNNFTAGAEWLIGFGEHVEAGVGLSLYRRTVPSVLRLPDFAREIGQDFQLRVMPITAVARFLLGRAAVQPYVGGGVGVFNWRYSEVGEFVDFTTLSTVPGEFVAEGNDVGGVFLGGVRVQVGSGSAVGAEVRYQQAKGVIGPGRFASSSEQIDLSGLTTQFTFQVQF